MCACPAPVKIERCIVEKDQPFVVHRHREQTLVHPFHMRASEDASEFTVAISGRKLLSPSLPCFATRHLLQRRVDTSVTERHGSAGPRERLSTSKMSTRGLRCNRWLPALRKCGASPIKVGSNFSETTREKTYYSSTATVHDGENDEGSRRININLVGTRPSSGRGSICVMDSESRSAKDHHPHERRCGSNPDQPTFFSATTPQSSSKGECQHEERSQRK